jgi:hypothetical protein
VNCKAQRGWYLDGRGGMAALPWRILPAIPFFVLSAMPFLTIVAPVSGLALLARWGYLGLRRDCGAPDVEGKTAAAISLLRRIRTTLVPGNRRWRAYTR